MGCQVVGVIHNIASVPLCRLPLSAPEWLRTGSGRLLTALALSDRLPYRPSLYLDRSIRGRLYFKLQFRIRPRQRRTYYIGWLTKSERQLLGQHIADRWPTAQQATRINDLNRLRQAAHDRAVLVAARTGYHFLGHRLFRCGSVTVVDQAGLGELRRLMVEIHEIDGQRWALQRDSMPYLSLRGQRRTCGTLRRISLAMRATDESIRKLGRVLEKEFI